MRRGFCLPRLAATVVTFVAVALTTQTPLFGQTQATPGASVAAAPGTQADRTWIDAWAVSYLPTLVNGAVQNAPALDNQTLRLNVFSKLAGDQARVKFTNKYCTAPLVIGSAHIALRKERDAIAPETDRVLTFKGEKKVTIAPGEEVWSDAVKLDVPQHGDVAISVYLPEKYQPTGFHPTGLKTSYIGAGDQTAAAVFAAAAAPTGRGGRMPSTNMVLFVSDLQVMAPATTRVIVTLGDSITDGAASATEVNGSWPDVLSKRLPKLADGTPVAVINMGIGSNRFVSADAAGPAGIKRLADDVLARPNVKYLILMEGINDISYEQAPPQKLIDAYQEAITRAHAKGIKVYGATLLPIQNSRKDTPENIATQQAVNKWIRESKAFDAVLDFEKVVQDPANPLRIRRDLTGDYVHPNTQGYKLIGESIDPKLFE